MKKTFTLSALALIAGFTFKAQNAGDLKVYQTSPSGAHSPEKLLQSLVGDGVVLKSYSISKLVSNESYGFFEDSKARLGLKKGLIMTTGGIAGISAVNTKPNMSNNTHHNAEKRFDNQMATTVSSPDLEKLLNNQKTFDACVIELDIVPTADTLSFNYVFGSEEYDEYVGSSYNDVFAFFISGKGVDGTKNLAVVPGTTTPVSINSINNGSGGSYSYGTRPTNSSYYVSNVDGHVGIEYDGLTKLMEIRQAVTPYETYHLKLAIADVADDAFDSGVLLEGHSIVSYEKTYNVLYENNSSAIESGYQNLLNALALEYQKNPTVSIKITGHTDADGSQEMNDALSCERANGVYNYLIKKGIAASRLIVDCKGEMMPAYNNNEEKTKILNRRTEIKILGTNQEYKEKKTTELIENVEAKLIKNFPNPFDQNTTIELSLPLEVKQAMIVVSDISGKTVKTIHVLERGKTSIVFDGGSLNNGTYIATLITDNKTNGSLKMVLQK